MLKFLIFAFIVGQAYALESTRGRIVNGTDAEEGEFPFAAHLRKVDEDYLLHCGASILNKNFLLTAGHCVDCKEDGTTDADPALFDIQYGVLNITTDDTNSVNISKFHCNNLTRIIEGDGEYVEFLHDILILELETPLPDDGSWEPVTLSRTFNTTVQQKGVVIGWGVVDMSVFEPSITLQKLTMDIYDNNVCAASTRGDWDDHVCVGADGHGGPCWGDSGTAALVDGIQVGLTSYTTIYPQDCVKDNATHPAVYTRVEKYIDWILSITQDVHTN